MYGNEYEEFSPISSEVRDRLLELDGVNREDSYVMEGAYLMTNNFRKRNPSAGGKRAAIEGKGRLYAGGIYRRYGSDSYG